MATMLLDVDTGHKDMIHDAQLDYYAKKLATCSSDATVKVYDIHGDQQYSLQSDLKGHEGPVWQVAWAHPKFGVVLASCSFDGKVIIHREQSGQWQKIFVYDEMKSSVNSIAWSPHEYDLCLACVTSDGKLSILSHNSDDTWKATVKEAPNKLGLNAVSWAPYGSSSHRRLVTGGCDNVVRIWGSRDDGREWTEEDSLADVHKDWVRDVAWAPSIGLPCNSIASCSEDGKVVVWTQREQEASWVPVTVRDIEGTPMWRVSWSLTGSVLAVSSGNQDVTLWKEAATGNSWIQVSDINEDAIRPLQQNESETQEQSAQMQQQQQQQQQQQPMMNMPQDGYGGDNYQQQQGQPAQMQHYQAHSQGQFHQQNPSMSQGFQQPQMPPQQQYQTQPQGFGQTMQAHGMPPQNQGFSNQPPMTNGMQQQYPPQQQQQYRY